MLFINQYINLLPVMNYEEMLNNYEMCTKVSHGSKLSSTIEEKEKFLINLIKNKNHSSTLEHIPIKFYAETSISVQRELFRHRHISPTEQSTRYVTKDELVCVLPINIDDETKEIMIDTFTHIENNIKKLRTKGIKNDVIREMYPLCYQTKFYITTNLRELLTIISLRTSKEAHPMIRELMFYLKEQLIYTYPVFREILN